MESNTNYASMVIELNRIIKIKEAALINARDALQLCRPEHVTRPAIKAINEVLS